MCSNMMDEATRRFVKDNLEADVRSLALKKTSSEVDLPMALQQIEARQLLRKKVPSWSENDDLLFPVHLSIEQCSSEATALYKADLAKGGVFADLTGGLGVDCHFISKNFAETHYVEMNPGLCAIASHNFAVLQHPVKVWNEDAEHFLEHCGAVDCIFIDPARRDQYGRKTVSISDCTPDVVRLQDVLLEKSEKVMIKLSPMLDIAHALTELKHVREVHVLSVANECKELLLVLERGYEGPVSYCCANLLSPQPILQFSQEEEREASLSISDGVGAYLYEPNASIMKGGFFKSLSVKTKTRKLHKNSNLYTSDVLVDDFPGRIFQVEGWDRYNKKLKQTLLADVDRASVAVRNFPLTVAELRKTLKIADGDEIYLFATTLKGEEKVLIKTKKIIC